MKLDRLFQVALATAAVTLAGTTAAQAQSANGTVGAPRQVKHSGSVFHVSACGDAVAPGYARCHAHIVTDARGAILSRPGMANPNFGARGNATPQGYGPTDLRSAYAITGSGSSAMTIAVVDAYGYSSAETDLGTYRSTYGLPACTTANGCFRKVNEYGGASYPRNDTGWSQETALDLDMVSAMCPNCHILLVEASTSSYADLANAEMTAAQLGAHAISNSYGGGEQGTSYYESAYDHPGVAVTVSTGDSGYGAEFPATSPHVTAVGGTSLTRASNARGWSETTWVDGGSGCSSVYAKPSWQHDALCTRRMEADVSAIADPNTGVAVYGPTGGRGGQSGWMIFGGTSVAAPLTAGVYGVNGGSVNYGSNPYSNTASLNDVTSGSNGSCGGTYFCTAGGGYDGPTGLGTPKGQAAY
jgi:subtilase family serine protease